MQHFIVGVVIFLFGYWVGRAVGVEAGREQTRRLAEGFYRKAKEVLNYHGFVVEVTEVDRQL